MARTEQETLNLLLKRTERLNKEYAVNAPAVIKITEVRLILEACSELLT